MRGGGWSGGGCRRGEEEERRRRRDGHRWSKEGGGRGEGPRVRKETSDPQSRGERGLCVGCFCVGEPPCSRRGLVPPFGG